MAAIQRVAMYFQWKKKLNKNIITFYKTTGPIHMSFLQNDSHGLEKHYTVHPNKRGFHKS